jgi:hypothetical protein
MVIQVAIKNERNFIPFVSKIRKMELRIVVENVAYLFEYILFVDEHKT